MMMSLGSVKIARNLEIERLLKNFVFNGSNDLIIESKKPESELIQFLGLRDKNGKIIHFGDILTDGCNNLLTPVCEIENAEHKLFFKPVQHLDKKTNMGCKSTYSATLEIIGNIYTGLFRENYKRFSIFMSLKNLLGKVAIVLLYDK